MSNKSSFAWIFALLAGSFTCHLHGVSLTLINDSALQLTAEIYNANGIKEGSVDLMPGQSTIWYGNNGSFRSPDEGTVTPYAVKWLCRAARPFNYSTEKRKKGQKTPPKYQSEYGRWDGVPSTASVNATGCTTGSKTCIIKKEAPAKKPTTATRVHKAPPRHPNERKPNISTGGAEKFSNDGGLTWSNDGPSPFADFSEDEFSQDQGPIEENRGLE